MDEAVGERSWLSRTEETEEEAPSPVGVAPEMGMVGVAITEKRGSFQVQRRSTSRRRFFNSFNSFNDFNLLF